MIKHFLKQTFFYSIWQKYRLLTKKSISQQGQDYWVIHEVFKKKKGGYFVEIGSADGETINNTYLLEKLYQWKGICIEPNPKYFEKLVQVRSATCLNICVDRVPSKVDFFLGGLHGGILESHHYDLSKQKNLTQEQFVKIDALPLVDLLRKYDAPSTIDYLSIDVEGAEERILGDFPFHEYTFLCLTVELPSKKLQEILESNGYICVKVIPGLDHCYIHQSITQQYRNNSHNFYNTNSLGDRVKNLLTVFT